jgi:hypothetical protein
MTKWSERIEIKNWEVIFGMIISCIAGFVWAYLHYGKGVAWI